MIDDLVRRPRHCALGLLALGMALANGPAGLVTGVSAALLVAGACCVAGGRRRAAALALVGGALVLAGAAAGTARIAALERTRLPQDFGHALSDRVIAVEPLRRRAFGQRTAVARLRGERVVLRAGRGVRFPAFEVGAELWVRGGLFAPDRVAAAARAHAVLRLESVSPTGRRRGGIAGFVDDVRTRAQVALGQRLPPELAALLRGMVLGQDAGLDDRARDSFRASGLSHLTAASGQNVMLLGALAMAAGTLLGLSLQARLWCVLGLVAVYVPLAGAGPSIQRAGIMGAAGLIAALAGRPEARWYAVVLAAAVTLGIDPRAVGDVGWQLSFAAVLALLGLAPALRSRMVDGGVPRGLAEAAAVTLAATVATAPLLAVHFDQVSIVSLPANLAATPAVAPIMWLGMTAAAVGQVAPGAAAWPDALAALPLAYLAWLARVAAGAPGATVSASLLTTTFVSCAAILVMTGAHRRLGCTRLGRRLRAFVPRPTPRAGGSRRSLRGVPAASVACVLFALILVRAGFSAPPPPEGFRVTFLDIGQGDATLVRHGDAAMLFDAGPREGPILQRLREQGVRRLDVLVLTHTSSDHDGGLAAVLRTMPVALLVDGRDGLRTSGGEAAVREARARQVRMVRAEAGLSLRAGVMAVRLLWPPPKPIEPTAEPTSSVPLADANLRATVAEISDGGARVLLTADAESEVLGGLDLGRVDAMKVSHHGSRDLGLAPVLQRLMPAVAVISVGAGNTYGHPVPSTLKTLHEAGVQVLRTDRDGTVQLDFPAAGGAPRVTRRA